MQVCVALRGLIILGIPGFLSSRVEGQETGTGTGLRRNRGLRLSLPQSSVAPLCSCCPGSSLSYWLRVHKREHCVKAWSAWRNDAALTSSAGELRVHMCFSCTCVRVCVCVRARAPRLCCVGYHITYTYTGELRVHMCRKRRHSTRTFNTNVLVPTHSQGSCS